MGPLGTGLFACIVLALLAVIVATLELLVRVPHMVAPGLAHSADGTGDEADDDEEEGTHRELLLTGVSGGVGAPLQYNCDVQMVYTMDDAECSMLCRPPGVYLSRNGACVNALIFDKTVAIPNPCSPEKGLFAYLVGDTQFGSAQLVCLSVDPGVQPDSIADPNTICIGGRININYVTEFPQLESCVCPDETTLAAIPNTSVVRSRGVCVPKTVADLFRATGALVHDKKPPSDDVVPDGYDPKITIPSSEVSGPSGPNWWAWHGINA